jgi:hypothetical protein
VNLRAGSVSLVIFHALGLQVFGNTIILTEISNQLYNRMLPWKFFNHRLEFSVYKQSQCSILTKTTMENTSLTETAENKSVFVFQSTRLNTFIKY